MSSTTTTVSVSTATTIHAIEPPKDADGTYGTIKFAEPDLSVGSDERSLFAVPATKAWETVCLPLHDFRTSPLLPHKGTLAGLDFAGFTVAHQDTKMQGEEWFDPAILKEVYFPEVEQFVKDLTGCKTVVCNNATFRRRLAKNQQDPHYYKKRDAPDAVDKMLETGKMTLNGPMIVGSTATSSFEPVRGVHCDYTLQGLTNIVRHQGRADIDAAAAPALKALDSRQDADAPYTGPRYASYSIWRPLRTVKRDPLAVSLSGSVPISNFIRAEYRAASDRPDPAEPQREYKVDALMIKPDPEGEKGYAKQKWFWLPEQKKEEVLVIKLADSDGGEMGKGAKEMEIDGRKVPVSWGTGHGSPLIKGTEDEEVRESIEIRVLCFW